MRRVSFILMLVLITSLQIGCGGKKSTGGSSLPEAKYIKATNKSVVLAQFESVFSSELGKLIPAGSALEGNPLGISEKDVSRIVAGISSFSDQGPPAAIVVLTLTSSADKAAIKKTVEAGTAKEVHGKKYYDLAGAPGSVVHFDESGGMLVIGTTEEPLKTGLSDAKSSPLMDKVNSNKDQHFYAFLDVSSAKGAANQALEAPGAAMFKGFIEPLLKTKTLEIMVDLSGSELLHVNLDSGDADTAGKTNTALQAMLIPAKGFVGESLKNAPESEKASLQLAQETLDSITVETHGTVVEIALPRPKDLVNRVQGLMKGGDAKK